MVHQEPQPQTTDMNHLCPFPISHLPIDIQESLILPFVAKVGAAAVRSTSKQFCTSFDQQLMSVVIGRHGGHEVDRAVPFSASLLSKLVHRAPKLLCLKIRECALTSSTGSSQTSPQNPCPWPLLGPIPMTPISTTLQRLEISGGGMPKPMQALQCLMILCPNIKCLTCSGSGFNNPFEMTFLSGCSSLEHLRISGTGPTGLLPDLWLPPNLRRLDLGHCSHLRHTQTLSACSNLLQLSLSVNQSFDLSSLAALSASLSHLNLIFLGSGGHRSVQALSCLSSLVCLDLSTSTVAVSPRAALILATLPSLEHLILTHCTITDFSPLHGCKSLHALELALCTVDRGALCAASLGKCTTLRRLHLNMVDGCEPVSSNGSSSSVSALDRYGHTALSTAGALAYLRSMGVAVKVFSYSDLRPNPVIGNA